MKPAELVLADAELGEKLGEWLAASEAIDTAIDAGGKLQVRIAIHRQRTARRAFFARLAELVGDHV